MSTFYIKQHDQLPKVTAQLKQVTGSGPAAINLTGTEVRFLMRPKGSATAKVNALCTITDDAAGKVEYAWAAADTDTAGEYEGEFEIRVLATGVKQTVPTQGYIAVTVVDDVA